MQKIKQYYKKFWKQEPRSAIDLAIYNAACQIICTGYYLKHRKALKQTERSLAKIAAKNRKEKRSVFVFANGPSLKDLSFEKIAKLQKNKTHDVIALNSFLSKSGHHLKPDYAVFADSDHFQASEISRKLRDQFLADIEFCRSHRITTLVPAEYYSGVDLETKLAFCTIANINGKNTQSICKPVGFYRLTALYALTLAKQLGYHKIYIAGFDNSYFKDFNISSDGSCVLQHIHYYDDSSTNTTVVPLGNSTMEVFYDIYKHFQFIDKIAGNDDRFFNIAKETYLNTIPPDHSLDVYK